MTDLLEKARPKLRQKLLELFESMWELGTRDNRIYYSDELKEECNMKLDELGIPKDEDFKWKKARKKPIVIHFREVKRKEIINTREGQQTAFPEQDYIIKGVEGEEYPIKKDIFNKTYDVIKDAISPKEKCTFSRGENCG